MYSKNLIGLLVATIAASVCSAGAFQNTNPDQKNLGYYDISSVEIKKVDQFDSNIQVQDFAEIANDCSNVTANANSVVKSQAFDGGLDIDPTEIINLGQKLWAMIQANKAVVTTKTQTANALPGGVKCWDQLENWHPPRSEVYQVSYKNGFGWEVVNLQFAIVYSYGGQMNGVGAYLTNATVQYRKLDVSWGFNVDASVEIPMVTNVGKSNNPVAGMELTIRWTVNSLSHSESTASFFVFGDGRPTQQL